MIRLDPDLRRTCLFGPGSGAGAAVHDAMQRSGAYALIVDLEDFTAPGRRDRTAGAGSLAAGLARDASAGRRAHQRSRARDSSTWRRR